jgi:FAD synthase
VVVPPFDLGGRQVRSTEIRTAIAAGDLATARALLGRRVAVTGMISELSSGGREAALRFGVPVALPPAGPYAATLEPAIVPDGVPGRAHRAFARVGTDGTLRVRARAGIPPDGRFRVAFVARGDGRGSARTDFD